MPKVTGRSRGSVVRIRARVVMMGYDMIGIRARVVMISPARTKARARARVRVRDRREFNVSDPGIKLRIGVRARVRARARVGARVRARVRVRHGRFLRTEVSGNPIRERSDAR